MFIRFVDASIGAKDLMNLWIMAGKIPEIGIEMRNFLNYKIQRLFSIQLAMLDDTRAYGMEQHLLEF